MNTRKVIESSLDFAPLRIRGRGYCLRISKTYRRMLHRIDNRTYINSDLKRWRHRLICSLGASQSKFEFWSFVWCISYTLWCFFSRNNSMGIWSHRDTPFLFGVPGNVQERSNITVRCLQRGFQDIVVPADPDYWMDDQIVVCSCLFSIHWGHYKDWCNSAKSWLNTWTFPPSLVFSWVIWQLDFRRHWSARLLEPWTKPSAEGRTARVSQTRGMKSTWSNLRDLKWEMWPFVVQSNNDPQISLSYLWYLFRKTNSDQPNYDDFQGLNMCFFSVWIFLKSSKWKLQAKNNFPTTLHRQNKSICMFFSSMWSHLLYHYP